MIENKLSIRSVSNPNASLKTTSLICQKRHEFSGQIFTQERHLSNGLKFAFRHAPGWYVGFSVALGHLQEINLVIREMIKPLAKMFSPHPFCFFEM